MPYKISLSLLWRPTAIKHTFIKFSSPIPRFRDPWSRPRSSAVHIIVIIFVSSVCSWPWPATSFPNSVTGTRNRNVLCTVGQDDPLRRSFRGFILESSFGYRLVNHSLFRDQYHGSGPQCLFLEFMYDLFFSLLPSEYSNSHSVNNGTLEFVVCSFISRNLKLFFIVD